MPRSINLNRLKIPNADGPDVPIADYSVSDSCEVEVCFRNLEDRLIQEIQKYDYIAGCVAWFTSYPVLTALGDKETSIVIQKEDFLRPDSSRNHNLKLRRAYSRLKCNLLRYSLPGVGSQLSVASDPSMAPVRCVGNHNRTRQPAWPRMHNKFLVFCDVESGDDDTSGNEVLVPRAVWTGSFNVTDNANNSFENAVIISSEAVADAYLKEFAQIYALSEELDWESDWVAPQYRLGT